MKFKTELLDFPDTPMTKHFDEESIPAWLLIDGGWFYDQHVKTLLIGFFVDSEYQRITRVA